MTYLIAKQNKKLNVYIPVVYGCETWGDGYYQEYIKQKGESWYITSWQYGGEWADDVTNSYKLKVVCETENLQEVIKYLHKVKVPKEEFDKLLNDTQKQINNFIAFEKEYYKDIMRTDQVKCKK